METPLFRTKKSLGQHFLTSTGALAAIINTSNPTPEDIILEIGPGRGVLTAELLKYAGKVIAIEKDRELVPYLAEKFAEEIKQGKFDLREQDILDFDPDALTSYSHPYKIVANIPYNITGEIIRKFLTANYKPQSMTLLVQKEVAERIVAKNNKESVLSLSVKIYGTPTYIQTIKRGSFNPPPNVDSAILYIADIKKPKDIHADIDEEKFFTLIKAGFKSKRKKLISNLATLGIYDKSALSRAFEELAFDQNTRAEDLTLASWSLLLKVLQSYHP